MLNKSLIGLWGVAIFVLFLYSFVQVDLGLTLTRASFFQDIQRSFQYVGYFNRPLSAYLFIGIVVLLGILYLLTLFLISKKKVSLRTLSVLLILVSVILLFSYTATSYDIFNYIFDAKIVTQYHENPYIKKALDYPNDPMLGFMHWTHRTYPYGPTWLALTIPLSFMGGGYFVVTYFLFKALAVASYLISSFLIYKIVKITKRVDPLLALAFFSLNPLVIMETLVAGHNDIPMMAAALLGIYFLIVQKKYSAWLSLVLSAGIKFGTLILLPVFLWYPFSKRKNKDFILFTVCFFCMLAAVIAASTRTTFQPWYFLLCLPIAALILNQVFIRIFVVCFSLLILFQYVPFFFTGNFDPPIPTIMNQLLWLSIIVSLVMGIYFEFRFRVKK